MQAPAEQSTPLYIAVPVDATAIIQGIGLRGDVVLADNKPVALRIACEQLFVNAEVELIELALFSVERADLDPTYFVDADGHSQNATGSYPYTGNIPPVALKLVEFYLISDDEADAVDDVEVDLDVYGDFAKYL
jgi:hypothetical protein